MPIVTVKVFEGELTKDQTAEIIADITEAVIPYVGEAVRANTWVLVEEVKSGSWGIGGKTLGLIDLRLIQESARQAPFKSAELLRQAAALGEMPCSRKVGGVPTPRLRGRILQDAQMA